MSVSVANERRWLKTLKLLGYYTIIMGVILIILYVLKTFMLQVLGVLVIGVFVVIGFYFLGYLLIGVLSLLIIVGSVICAVGLLVYLLA
ncbi:hypothetical protein ABES33_27740 [Bacillus pseudomycoides]|uniref:hypothetical protein n=1 Tax=Bacillus pseudomycoides TaxID=64104 RepID=UPI003D1D3F52